MEASATLDAGQRAATVTATERSDAFESFFASTYKDVYRAVVLVTRDRVAAEDAVANAYLKAVERWDAVSVHANPLAWVVRVALNDSVSAWRRLRNLVPLAVESAALLAPAGRDPDLIRAVAALPLLQRQVVALRILVGLDTEGTASALGIAPGTVTAHLHRALGGLRERLQPSEQPRKPHGR
jgi:DNA-directed RNA polymerase specialized sigma24 family protein